MRSLQGEHFRPGLTGFRGLAACQQDLVLRSFEVRMPG